MPHQHRSVPSFQRLVLLLLAFSLAQAASASKLPLSIKSAVYNKKTASLEVKTVSKQAGVQSLIHSQGGLLGQSSDSEHQFSIPLAELGDIPCQVELRLGDSKVSKAVIGAPADCKKAPTCKLLSPAANSKLPANTPISFEAQVALKDKKAAPLTIEWDFAGGAMTHPFERLLKNGKPITRANVSHQASFVRDNSRYYVRFSAMDSQGRRCENGIYVDVGNPPDLPSQTDLDAMVQSSIAIAPAKGNALKIPEGGKVVLPYQDWTMQTATDARSVSNVYVVYGPQVNNINAIVYEKNRQPPVVDSTQIDVLYSAATNPADPVGPNSINSTSQNFPLATPFKQATIQKSDFFERYIRPAEDVLADGYYSTTFMEFLTPELASAVDEGYHSLQLNPPLNPEHGRYMPGVNDPYIANEAQSFSEYLDTEKHFLASMLPLTDIDDSGRVNPVPLFRIEARDIGSEQAIAATDIVVNSGRDLHCRECHLKGKIGANLNYPKSKRRELKYYDADSDSIADLEYAAIRNIANLHEIGGSCGDNLYLRMENGSSVADEDGKSVAYADGPAGCNTSSCHTSALSRTPYKQALKMTSSGMSTMGRPLSDDMHRYHGRLQYKNGNKDDVVRVNTVAKVFDPEQNWDATTGSMPNSLFPVKDDQGNILPMEENCLKCHGGMREQCYRDRMYTAGVTCYQCHGDMLAVGNSFKKSMAGADGNLRREPWLDEPDCGSCHTGNANQGNRGNGGFFSGGVRTMAFDQADRSATPIQPDRFNPDANRFAVPLVSMDLGDDFYTLDGQVQPFTTQTPLFRAAKDNHGQVPCGACHGAAHAIWPNRDPNANDNVTSLQLQGHSGPIAECSVCHSDDAFAKRDDLDEGIKAAQPILHVLGGPHNMHPINDPNWWQAAATDKTANQSSGKINGGWHNDYAKFPGRAREDQCAACHGNDHLGTRLAKTPVAREFINDKGKKISVKAGTVIGCNLCHSLEKSCVDSPAKLACGKPSEAIAMSTNLAPVIGSQAKTKLILGDDYLYAVDASDPEGGELSYKLLQPAYNELIIDENAAVSFPAAAIETIASNWYGSDLPTVLFEYQLLVSDDQGAKTMQSVQVSVDCPAGLLWDAESKHCAPVVINSKSPVSGVNAEQEYSYQVIAKQSNGKSLSYSLSNQPEEMTINSNSGLIKWMPAYNAKGVFTFMITASNEHGDFAQQQVALTVCPAPLHWDDDYGQCRTPVNIISTPQIYGITAGKTYTYQVTATQVNHLPLTYTLSNQPQGMLVDSKTGLISWTAQAQVSGPVAFTVNAKDILRNQTQQAVEVIVCAAPEHWNPANAACKGPIEFTSTPSWGIDTGQLYSYQVDAIHANGLAMSYSVADTPGADMAKPAGVSIDSQTGLLTWMAQAPAVEYGGYSYFDVVATDSNGYSSHQTVEVLVCGAGTNWGEAQGFCRGDVRITSTLAIAGLDVGENFSYQVTATDQNPAGQPIVYSLENLYPEDLSLTINPDSGLINWLAEDVASHGSYIAFTITATDKFGQSEQQNISLNVCSHPQHWNATEGYCQ